MALPLRPLAGVTGGARGIGSAYVSALLAKGFVVAIFDCDGAAQAAAALGGSSAGVTGWACDVADARSFRAAFDQALAWSGRDSFRVFVCNAGVLGTLFAQAERIVAVNLLGAIRGAEMAIKQATASLTRRAELDVIITASTNGLVPADSDLAPVYVATKFGIVGFVRSLQPLASRYGVRVNAIAPVTVDTPMVAGLIPPEVGRYLETGGRGGVMPPSSCAAALLHIMGDPSLAGEVVVVHPDAPGGHGFAVEPLVCSQWLGQWRESESAEVATFVDDGLKAVADGSLSAWSGV